MQVSRNEDIARQLGWVSQSEYSEDEVSHSKEAPDENIVNRLRGWPVPPSRNEENDNA